MSYFIYLFVNQQNPEGYSYNVNVIIQLIRSAIVYYKMEVLNRSKFIAEI